MIVGSMPYARQGYLINNKGDTIFYLEAAQHIGGRPNHKKFKVSCHNMKFAIISDRKAISLQLLFSLSVLEFKFKHIFISKIL